MILGINNPGQSSASVVAVLGVEPTFVSTGIKYLTNPNLPAKSSCKITFKHGHSPTGTKENPVTLWYARHYWVLANINF